MTPLRLGVLIASGALACAGAARSGFPVPIAVAAGATARPTKGKLLVATRQLGDPNFGRSVVLLLSYDEQGGAMGVIVNRPTPVGLAAVLPQFDALAGRGDRVWMGGPVMPASLLVLQRAPHPPDGSAAVFADVYVLTSRAGVEAALRGATRAAPFRAYAGYAGWAPGQLEYEIARGDWRVVSARADVVFSATPEDVWERMTEASEGQQWTGRRGFERPRDGLAGLRSTRGANRLCGSPFRSVAPQAADARRAERGLEGGVGLLSSLTAKPAPS